MESMVKFFSQVDLEAGIASLSVFIYGEGPVKLSFQGEEREVMLNDSGVREDFFILSVRLWKGVQDPYLYSFFVDEREYKFGLRTFGINRERGFYLNGERYPLNGKNTLVTHSISDLDKCDKEGIISSFIFPFGHIPTLFEISELSLHPSLVFWGYEIDGEKEEEMRRLNSILYSLDKTRATMALLDDKPSASLFSIFDVTMMKEETKSERGIVIKRDGKGFIL